MIMGKKTLKNICFVTIAQQMWAILSAVVIFTGRLFIWDDVLT